jgi:hypothetical protein
LFGLPLDLFPLVKAFSDAVLTQFGFVAYEGTLVALA